MVKRFVKGKLYTLCLLFVDGNGEIITYSLNTMYKGNVKGVAEFNTTEETVHWDKENNICWITDTETDTVLCFRRLVNVVAGWQF